MNYSYYLQPCKFIKNKYSLHLVCQNKTYINNNTDVNKKIKNRSKTLFYSLKNNNISELSLNNVIYKTKKPSVSIIMPVYNSEKYLDDALNDILNQTFKDYELICIDDSSTDKSLSILLKYSKKDKRVFVINKNKENAGAARNLGFQLSRGKYLMFLDSDDRFEPTLLKKMYEDISKKDSDVSICNAIKFDDKTNNEIKSNLILKGRYPDQSPFNHKTIKDNLYLFCTPCPWNKIFKRSLIEDNNIKFQEIPRANDLFFVYYALTKARQISIIEEKLVRYRTGTSSNLQSGNDKSPFAFLKSLIFLKDKLENDGIFNGYIKKSFINMAISVCIYNINSLKKQKNKDIILYWLKKKGLKKLGLIPNEKNFYLYNNDKKIKEYFNVNIK
jgi:glycosyltransferase involved in cell wall biosynthesis